MAGEDSDYKIGLQNFEKFKEEIKKYGGLLSEADTRCKIIDKILIECLRWDGASDITREEYVNKGYIDYALKTEGRGLIVEAKKVSIEFELPASIGYKSKLTIGDLLRKEKNLEKHYEQVLEYCIKSGIQFGCFTNGLDWIVFPATRMDGIQIHRGRAIVFRGMDEIHENFVNFWNILSKKAIESGDVDRILLPEIGIVKESKILNCGSRIHEKSNRNILSKAITPVLPGYFGDLTDASALERLGRCYVAGTTFSDEELSKTVSTDPHVIQYPTQEDVSENLTRTMKEFQSKDFRSGIAYVLLGRVGSGKTTFLFHYFFVKNIKFSEENLVYYLDFLDSEEFPSIKDFFFTKIREISDNAEIFKKYTGIDDLEKIFQNDIDKIIRGPLGKIKNKEKIEEKIAELLFDISKKEAAYYPRIIKYLKKKKGIDSVIIFDNVDQLKPEEQEDVINST